MLPMQEIQVRSLVGELRSHMPCGMAKKKKIRKTFLYVKALQQLVSSCFNIPFGRKINLELTLLLCHVQQKFNVIISPTE